MSVTRFVAVSYTHLDVYKRQCLARAMRNSWPIFPVQSSSRLTCCISVSGKTFWKRGARKPASGELAAGLRSILLGVNTISGLRLSLIHI